MNARSPLRALGLVGVALAITVLPVRAQEGLGTTGIRGAGSTFAYPILSKWSQQYRLALTGSGRYDAPNTGLDDPPASSALDYEPVGSLAGMQRVKAAAVDFGASDVPLESTELAKLGLGQFPIVIGGVAVVYNIDGAGATPLRFTGPLLADIFAGKVTNWSDPGIVALNPDVRLPNAAIVVVRRSDGSGTTFNFTHYLSKVSEAWKTSIGSDLAVKWPVGRAAKGNDGIARTVSQVRNSISYVEYGQALQSRLAVAAVKNRAGQFVRPSADSLQAAAAAADWGTTRDFALLLTDTGGAPAYPIVATVFVLMKPGDSSARSRAAIDFFRWSLDHGTRDAAQLGYVPLPPALVDQVKAYWRARYRDSG